MSLVGFESAFPKVERLQTLALDHMVTIIGSLFVLLSSDFINICRNLNTCVLLLLFLSRKLIFSG